ncbi:MAG TPA: GGDEF domain-containing protein [Solirubrobacteraceae bacterium]
MSTAAGLGSLTRLIKALPTSVAAPVAAATAASALLVLAGSSFGAGALFFCIPAAVGALLAVLRFEARQQGLRLLSQQDPLTGLANRRAFLRALGRRASGLARTRKGFALAVVDLDGFKKVNDRYGHAAGDEILREIARSLEKAVRDQDTVARMGGDEFCILAPEIGWEDAERLAARLELAVKNAVSGLDMLGVSVGFAVFPDEGWTPEQLLVRADEAGMETKRRQKRHLRAA